VRPKHWKHDVLVEEQPRLCPLLDALKRLCQEGLMAALILSAADGSSAKNGRDGSAHRAQGS
jgi:hypothetical protein